MSEMRAGRKRSSRTLVRLPDLPDEIIMEIAERLSLIDVGNLMSCCRVLASQAKYFYEQRRAVNMSCFETVTPAICNRLITRFSRSCLLKLHFCYDVYRHHKYDEETLEAILAHFSFSTRREIELYAGRRRMVHFLAHGYFLNKFLSSQQHLQYLEVDMELEHVTLEIVGRNCPVLEYYSSGCITFNHTRVLTAFLQSCPRLKFANVCFLAGFEELDMCATLPYPLELREASFYLDEPACKTKLRILGSRLQKIETACVFIGREECLKECIELVKAMPPLRQLLLTLFYRSSQVRGPARGPFFVGVFSLLSELHHAPTCLELNDVPEEEFEKIVEVNAFDMLPKEMEHLKILFDWRSCSLDQAREALLDKFMYAAALRLKSCTVGVMPSSSGDQQPTFLKTIGHCKIA